MAVLVVDDMVSFRSTIGDLLRGAGYQTVFARDGAEALQILTRQKCIGVVTDLNMPNLNGDQLVSAIRNSTCAATRDLPIIVVSSQSGNAIRRYLDLIGADAFVPKPIEASSLLEAAAKHFY